MKRLIFILYVASFDVAVADPARDKTIIEAIMRMANFDLNSSDKAKAAVERYLKANWGTEEYLNLIRHFELKGEEEGLLRLTLEPNNPLSAQAASLIDFEVLKKAANGEDDEQAARAIGAIANIGKGEQKTIVAKIAADPSRSVAVRRSALQALARDKPAAVLELLKGEKIPAALKEEVIGLLVTSRDDEVRTAALAMKRSSVTLPPIEVLAKRKGDPENGRKVFNTSCAACHLPSPLNIDFGPNLSQIGDKLPRSEMFVSILDPGAGVSFGYETTTVTLKDESQMIGFLVSQTDDTIALKLVGGIVQEFPRSTVAAITQTKDSLMPKGLEQTMSEQGLVDLVEYMVLLKKQGPK